MNEHVLTIEHTLDVRPQRDRRFKGTPIAASTLTCNTCMTVEELCEQHPSLFDGIGPGPWEDGA